jgi:hypothetical protein
MRQSCIVLIAVHWLGGSLTNVPLFADGVLKIGEKTQKK